MEVQSHALVTQMNTAVLACWGTLQRSLATVAMTVDKPSDLINIDEAQRQAKLQQGLWNAWLLASEVATEFDITNKTSFSLSLSLYCVISNRNCIVQVHGGVLATF